MLYEREYSSSNKANRCLSKDNLHKKLSGVCSGVASHYDYSRLIVRLVAIAAFIMFPITIGVAYIVASVLLPEGNYY